MSSEGKNLLAADGAVTGYRLVPGYAWPGCKEAGNVIQRAKCEPGKTYTVGMVKEVTGQMCFGFYLTDGTCTRPNGYMWYAAGKYATQTLTAPDDAEYVVVSWCEGERRPMLVEGTTPAAWAPADGESLPGGGALMSANLLEGIKPTLANRTTESDGVWHNAGRTSTDGHDDWLVWDLAGQSTLATNQTYHVGLSTRGASANPASLRATIGYRDAAGNVNFVNSYQLPIGTSWGRAEATIVVPSGMTPFGFYVAAYGTCPETWLTSPTLSYGDRGPVYALASDTLAWSAGVASVTRYWQLALPTAATPAVPASSSSLGSWSATEPAVDTSRVLWTCECTRYTDGTESWSQVGKSTSYEAAKDAKDAAGAAKDAADGAQATAEGAAKDAASAAGAADKAQATADGIARSRALVATCPTAAATAAKVAALASGSLSLEDGASVTVVFAEANEAASPTLDVGGTGARPILTQGSASAYWAAGAAVALVYSGGAWNVASAPVYASTADVGDPGGRHVHVGSSSVDVMDGRRVLASFGDSRVELGRGMEVPDDSDSTRSAVIDLIDSTATLMATVLTVAKGIALKVLEIATPILRIRTDKMVSLSARHDRAGSKEYSNVLVSAYVDLAEDSTGAEAGNAPVISVTCAHRDASGTITDQTWALTHEGVQGPGGVALPVYRAASRPQEADYAAARPCVVVCDDGTAWLIS